MQISNTNTSTPGRPESGQLLGASEAYQVKPGATYVTSAPDPSNVSSFTTTAISQPKEPGAYINSQKLGSGNIAFITSAVVALAPPSAKPDAVSHINIGYIQKGDVSGFATYTLKNVTRLLSVPTNGALDWYSSGSTDKFPWYDSSALWSPSGSGAQSHSLTLSDAPSQDLPSEWRSFTAQGQLDTTNPNNGQKISSSSVALNFHIFMAAQTQDTENGANKNYFDEGDTYWGADFNWPVDPLVSIIRAGNPISPPTSVTPISTNIVPLSINRGELWATWLPRP